jgi:6-phosphogluconolactonase (cycloisomerase 2 family)
MRPISVKAKVLITTAFFILSACGGDHALELHKVGGTVTGLSGTGLALQINSRDYVSVSADGSFTFPKSVARGETYGVTVKTQPTQPPQTCVIANGEGTIGTADIVNVAVTCTLATARFAFVSNADDFTISAFTINSTDGSLAPVAGSPFATGAQQLYALTISPSGKFLVAADGQASTVLVFSVDPTSGALTQVAGSPFTTEVGAGTSGVGFDKTGTYLYAANYLTNNVSAFSVNADTGALSAVAGSPFAGADGAITVVVDPSGKFALVTDFTTNAVSVFSIDSTSGALTPVTGSPFSNGSQDSPIDLDFGAGGKFVYVSNLGTTPDGSFNVSETNLSGFSLNPSNGELVALTGSPFAIPQNGFIATNQPGSVIYVPTLTDLSAYSVDAASGAPTQIAGSPYALGTDTSEVTVERSGRFVYVTNSGENTVTGYASDASTGALTVIPGSPVSAGAYPYNIVTY